MTVTTHWTDRLSEYLDDEMSATERAACDTHLAVCSACREALDGLQWVVTTARADADQAPPADLWPGVLQRMVPADAGGRADVPQPDFASARSRATRQVVFTLPQLALAASLLIAVSAGVAYLAAGRVVSPPDATVTVVQAFAEPVMAPSADVARADFADAQYDEAVADLEKILADLRDELNPQTVMVIERNLASIDQAIREARAALDADPANTFLNSHLADARRKKLDLLRRATAIHSISGD
jgi:tetratricopeptide (TPR) repeat protein